MNSTINQVTATFTARLAEVDAQLEGMASIIMGQGYIVRVGDLTVSLVTDDKGVFNGSVRQNSTELCTRFTKEAAVRVAAKIKNGLGDVGQAIHVIDALKDERSQLIRLLDTITTGIAA